VSTATATRPSEHVEHLCEDAAAMGWDVKREANSIKVIPPKGSSVKAFSVSTNPSPAPPQLAKTLSENGFLRAWQAFEREQGKTSKPAGPAQGSTGAQPTVCPECVEAGVKEPYTTDRGASMGAHRNRKHGVEGTAKKAVPAKKATAAKPSAKKTAPAKAPAGAVTKAPELAATVKAVSQPVETSGSEMPVKVAAAVAALVHAVGSEVGDVAALRAENERLHTFADQVLAEASDGTKAPVQVVANILDLAKVFAH
jgi:hypothetical protein